MRSRTEDPACDARIRRALRERCRGDRASRPRAAACPNPNAIPSLRRSAPPMRAQSSWPVPLKTIILGPTRRYSHRMDKRLLDILCCPATKVPVRPRAKGELDSLNRSIAGGDVQTVDHAAVSNALQSGLITTDGKLIYRIEDDIPVMLANEAIATLQLNDFPSTR